jgi:pimeloyl-ACP methyl ester carboxylesterase
MIDESLVSAARGASIVTAPTQFLQVKGQDFAYRRFGEGSRPVLLLQHFTGTLDNWDPAVTDPLASGRDVILFENAGVGRSLGKVPESLPEMAMHAVAFLDALGLRSCDVLGFSLGGLIAQQMSLDHPALIRRMILVGTAPRGGEDIMHLEKPSLAKYMADPTLLGSARLQKIFFAPTETSQLAGKAFIKRLAWRVGDREPVSGPGIARAQLTAFREWECGSKERFAYLKNIRQPTLVVSGILDEMIAVQNSIWLATNMPNSVLLTYPDSGHGCMFQFHESFTRQAAAFLDSDSEFAPY